MYDKLISVVVPVYNVELFLDKCIKSLLSQDYDNLEILLIDDGSPDRSGEICDFYASKYDKIRTFHKENGGLSDARNYALSFTRGEYVMFIDSDDYVDNCIISSMAARLNEDIDIVVSPHIDERENGEIISQLCEFDEYTILTSEEALEKMCYQVDFSTSACGKLIKRELLLNFPFPKGKLYEDLAVMYKIVGSAKRVGFTRKTMYHYVQHSGSIRFNIWSDKVYDVIEATDKLIEYIKDKYPRIIEAAIYRYFFSANEVYVRAFLEKKYLDLVKPIRQQLYSYWNIVKADKNVSNKQKIRFWLMIFQPVLYRTIWKIVRGK